MTATNFVEEAHRAILAAMHDKQCSRTHGYEACVGVWKWPTDRELRIITGPLHEHIEEMADEAFHDGFEEAEKSHHRPCRDVAVQAVRRGLGEGEPELLGRIEGEIRRAWKNL